MTVTECLERRASVTTNDLGHIKAQKLAAEFRPGQSFTLLKTNVSKLCSEIQESPKCKQIVLGIELIETLAFQFILRAFFVDLKWTPELGEKVTLDSFMREYKIRRVHRKLFQALLDRLEYFGFLTKASTPGTDESIVESWTVSKPPASATEITTQIKYLQTRLLEYPELSAEIEFLNQTAENLADVLRGKMNGFNILYPAENVPEFQFGAQQFYSNSQLLDTFKTVYITHGALTSARQMVAEGQTVVRILEITAGTDSTTIPLLTKLTALAAISSFEIHYTFTNISIFLLEKQNTKLKKMFPTVKFEFESLDIEQGSETQKFFIGKSQYDIVVAANVFHGTQYLDDTLKHTREYVKPGGILVLGEVFKSSIFLDISFGLTEGWWRFADENRAPNSPLISNTKWEELIKMAGFSDTFSVSSGGCGVVFGLADQAA